MCNFKASEWLPGFHSERNLLTLKQVGCFATLFLLFSSGQVMNNIAFTVYFNIKHKKYTLIMYEAYVKNRLFQRNPKGL